MFKLKRYIKNLILCQKKYFKIKRTSNRRKCRTKAGSFKRW